jgi:hypothetical protein
MVDIYPIKLEINGPELSTILAALRYYQEHHQDEPSERTDRIQAIATNDDTETSLDDDGIDVLCMRINTSGTHDAQLDRFRNMYLCPGNLLGRVKHAPRTWTDCSPSMNNDKCSVCNAEIEPLESEDL